MPKRLSAIGLLCSMSMMLLLHGCTKTSTDTDSKSISDSSNGGSDTATASPMSHHTEMRDKHLVEMPKDAEKEAGIGLDEARNRKLDMEVTVTGEVQANANTQTHVTTPVTGRVTDILVNLGDHVVADKTLLVIRSTDIQQAETDLLQNAQQVRSDLKQALVQIECDTATAEASVKLDEKVFKRLKGLFEEKIASQADFQIAETTLLKDQINLTGLNRKREATISLSTEKMKLTTEPAKTKLRLLGVSDEEIDRVEKTQVVDPLAPVKAPEGGIVVERLVNVGELIDPSKPLFTIGDFRNVWLKADVFEKDIAKVSKGQNVDLEVDSFPGKVFHGKLDYVANQIDSDTRTLSVRADVTNPQSLLKPKMFARMTIHVGEHTVLTIPKTAVQDGRTDKVVYIPSGTDVYEERKIKLGAEAGDYVEVLSGLKSGDKVVTKGSFDLRAEAVRTYG